MIFGLEGTTAVVTGGSSGIGRATVELLLEAGANVAFCARDRERLDAAAGQLAARHGTKRILAQPLDVLDADAVAGFARAVEARFSGCGILVNNAGQGRVSTFAETSDAAWREEVELKLFSQIHPIRAFTPLLRRSRGAVVAVNSLLAYQPEPHMVCTSAARASVQNLLKSLSVELAPEIRVNSVVLGLIDSGQWQRRFEARPDKAQSREAFMAALAARKAIPLGRLGTPREVAAAIVFLASGAAGYVTGAQLDVSGGLARHI